MKSFSYTLFYLGMVTATHAASFTNNVSVDAFVRASAPTSNYGAAGALSVSGPNSANGAGLSNGVFDSFIRFNTGSMVTNFNSLFGPNDWAITGAKLRVTEIGAPANTLFNRGVGAFEIRWISNDDWIEGTGSPNFPATNGIVYNNERALLNGASDVSLGMFTNSGTDSILSFSLALQDSFLSNIRAGGEVGLYLTAIDPGIGFTVDSRSFGTVSGRPSLEISVVPKPTITGLNLVGTKVVLGTMNGTAGGTYHLLTSTNMALPLRQWVSIATNLVIANGDFTITATNVINANRQQEQFFILQIGGS